MALLKSASAEFEIAALAISEAAADKEPRLARIDANGLVEIGDGAGEIAFMHIGLAAAAIGERDMRAERVRAGETACSRRSAS